MRMKAMTVKMQRCDDGDDAQASNYPSGNDDLCLSGSSPSTTSSSVSKCRISYLFEWDESI
jgi:hypothetical protein